MGSSLRLQAARMVLPFCVFRNMPAGHVKGYRQQTGWHAMVLQAATTTVCSDWWAVHSR